MITPTNPHYIIFILEYFINLHGFFIIVYFSFIVFYALETYNYHVGRWQHPDSS